MYPAHSAPPLPPSSRITPQKGEGGRGSNFSNNRKGAAEQQLGSGQGYGRQGNTGNGSH